jgi:hypothetical protein
MRTDAFSIAAGEETLNVWWLKVSRRADTPT